MSDGAFTRRQWRRLGRPLLMLVGTVLALTAGAVPASAHNVLRSTSPAGGETVQVAPSSVVLTFDQPALAMGTQVVVTGPSGEVQQGQPRLVDNTVSQDLQPGAPAGPYAVAWRVTSADGHPITGGFSFTATTAAAGQAPAPSSPPGEVPAPPPQRFPVALAVLLGAGLVALSIALSLRVRGAPRPGRHSPPD